MKERVALRDDVVRGFVVDLVPRLSGGPTGPLVVPLAIHPLKVEVPEPLNAWRQAVRLLDPRL